jgi:DNA-binding NarL/FixJ family response regulator
MMYKYALIADSDHFFRIALRSILVNNFGFEKVLEASSFPEAISIIESNEEIGIAFFEIVIPGARNLDIFRSLFAPAPDLRLVFVSESTQRSDILRALEIGARGYIAKINGPVELCRALRIVSAGDIYIPANFLDMRSVQRAAARLPETGVEKTTGVYLTPRQREVLVLIAAGHSNKQISRDLGLAAGTVKVHVAAAMRALNLPNRAALAAFAVRNPDILTD